jgi:hypothetical protein
LPAKTAAIAALAPETFRFLNVASGTSGFRARLAQYPGDPRGPELVAALTAASPKFAELWQQHTTARFRGHRKSYRHPTAGPLSLDIIALTASSNEQQHLTVLLPADQATADKLGQLR